MPPGLPLPDAEALRAALRVSELLPVAKLELDCEGVPFADCVPAAAVAETLAVALVVSVTRTLGVVVPQPLPEADGEGVLEPD